MAADREFLIYLLIYSNKLAYLQLTTVLVYRSSPPKLWTRGKTLKICVNEFIFRTCNFTKNYLKWLTSLKKLFLGIFQRFCLKVSVNILRSIY